MRFFMIAIFVLIKRTINAHQVIENKINQIHVGIFNRFAVLIHFWQLR